MVEPLPEKLDRIVSDIDKVLDLYDYAERLYSYQNIAGPISVFLHNDNSY